MMQVRAPLDPVMRIIPNSGKKRSFPIREIFEPRFTSLRENVSYVRLDLDVKRDTIDIALKLCLAQKRNTYFPKWTNAIDLIRVTLTLHPRVPLYPSLDRRMTAGDLTISQSVNSQEGTQREKHTREREREKNSKEYAREDVESSYDVPVTTGPFYTLLSRKNFFSSKLTAQSFIRTCSSRMHLNHLKIIVDLFSCQDHDSHNLIFT